MKGIVPEIGLFFVNITFCCDLVKIKSYIAFVNIHIDMPEILKQILNFLLLLCLVACSGRSDVTHLLNEVEMYMNEKTDSALYLLDSIIQPEDLSREQNALWCLLHTQAQDKNRIEHTSDSLIHK